jgi:nitrite reductase/ring-hydroxylating ferredoxin subunit
MPENRVLIGRSDELAERGIALTFPVGIEHGQAMAFAVRFDGRVHAYVNRCAHVPVELDWQPGRFFDLTRLYLICSTHGAVYSPETGVCVDGPCHGRKLQKLEVFESAGLIYWRPCGAVHEPPSISKY